MPRRQYSVFPHSHTWHWASSRCPPPQIIDQSRQRTRHASCYAIVEQAQYWYPAQQNGPRLASRDLRFVRMLQSAFKLLRDSYTVHRVSHASDNRIHGHTACLHRGLSKPTLDPWHSCHNRRYIDIACPLHVPRKT
jgi:hypothetical protein